MSSLLDNLTDLLSARGWVCNPARRNSLSDVLSAYQRFHGLLPTGEPNAATLASLQELRFCVWPDTFSLVEAARWPIDGITYHIAAASRYGGLTREEMEEAFRWAWEQVSNAIDFVGTYTSNPKTAHVVIGWGKIDGPFGTLAWSQLADGTLRQKEQRYDWDEPFVFSANPAQRQIDLARVVLHETGHLLGMPHIAAGNLLAPTYNPGVRVFQSGDKNYLTRTLGYRPAPAVPVPPPSPTPPAVPDPIVIKIWGADRIEVPGYKVTREG